jgi:hypothetical protein
MKVLVLGHAGHGKDTAANLLEALGLTFVPTSLLCAKLIVLPFLGVEDPTEEQVLQTYNARVNNREIWVEAIGEFCKDNPARFVEIALAYSDIYCGLRSVEQYQATRELFDVVLWISRAGYPLEPTMQISPDSSMIVIHNNGNLASLEASIGRAIGNFTRW